jgi:hypothetical protein
MTMDSNTLSLARSFATYVADDLHLAYYDTKSVDLWQSQAHRHLVQLAETMGYTITRKPDRDAELRANQTIEAAGMGGNGFAGAEYAAHVLTVAMRNGGAA